MAVIKNHNIQTNQRTKLTRVEQNMNENVTRVNGSLVKYDDQLEKLLEEKYTHLGRKYLCFRDEVEREKEKSLKKLPSFRELPYNAGISIGGASNNTANTGLGSCFGNAINQAVPTPRQPRNSATPTLAPNTIVVREYCPEEDLLLLGHKAQHPQYLDIHERLHSFATWTNQSQDPKGLAEAGFYYSGDDDRVRCFMCNGGLCNFERDDVPWFEHQKWFGNCPYVQKCINNPVVAAILETATTINGPLNVGCSGHNHGNGQTQCDINSTTPGYLLQGPI